jgi:penicillin-binding protein 2
MEQLANISKHYSSIINDPLLPMFNRAVQSPQPPGSVFKLVNALIALEEGVVTPETQYGCNMGFRMGGLKVGCHAHPSPLDLKHSIAMSCNAYYCYLLGDILNNRKNYRSTEEAFNKWNEYVHSFGFGEKLGSDIPHELGGYVPTSERYNRVYGKNAWKYLTIISLSIGQGEMGCTPLHLANLCATIANGGYYYRPHMIRASENYPLDSIYLEKQYTMVDTSHFRTIRDGMEGAVYWPGGTARKAQIDSIVVCGKTGTAQNPHGDDHSVFICFAPKDDPKIAIAAYVENGGFGATWAVPIASLLMEKYLKGEISDKSKVMEQYVRDGNLLHQVKKR